MYLPAPSDGAGLVHAVAEQERQLGRPLDIIERYHDMSAAANGIFPNAAERQIGRRHLLLFSWAPVLWSSGTKYMWRTVASGSLDRSIIVPEAERLRAYRHTVFLTFGAEADSNVWVQGSPAQFIAAWRHVHDVFARLGVRNVVWVWTTTGFLGHLPAIAAMYPGNAYVDWIGYDQYNFFTCHHTGWRSFGRTVRPFYNWLIAHHLNKPIMMPEYGSAQFPASPAREAAWYRGIVPVLRSHPRIKALVLWNSADPGCELRLSAAPAAVRGAYRQTGLSPYLRQAVPGT